MNAIFTTPGIYKKGVIIPQRKPQGRWGKVLVTFLPQRENTITKKQLEAMQKEDERIWTLIEPTFRKVRKELGRKYYPLLYGEKEDIS